MSPHPHSQFDFPGDHYSGISFGLLGQATKIFARQIPKPIRSKTSLIFLLVIIHSAFLIEVLVLSAMPVHYIVFDEAEQKVRATKLTGDEHVPRGAISWSFTLLDSESSMLTDSFVDLSQIPEFQKFEVKQIFLGTIHNADNGHFGQTDVPVFIGLISQDDLVISGNEYSLIPPARYRRYKGRNRALERVIRDGTRAGTW
ncbi:hypothetical protein K474DRAFT_1708186 [Panus rudis PR-1116 ss-1]|nr:hypothetical protein K474DRAFT_1708186 [Panus rudis PR-1116 ss-1]